MQTGRLHAAANELEAAEAALAKASACAAVLKKQLDPKAPDAALKEAATELFKLFMARADVAWRLQQSVRSALPDICMHVLQLQDAVTAQQ